MIKNRSEGKIQWQILVHLVSSQHPSYRMKWDNGGMINSRITKNTIFKEKYVETQYLKKSDFTL